MLTVVTCHVPTHASYLSRLRDVNRLCKFIAVLPSLVSVVLNKSLKFLMPEDAPQPEKCGFAFQNTLCPLRNGFCRPICVRQDPFCHSAVAPTRSGIMPRTLVLHGSAKWTPPDVGIPFELIVATPLHLRNKGRRGEVVKEYPLHRPSPSEYRILPLTWLAGQTAPASQRLPKGFTLLRPSSSLMQTGPEKHETQHLCCGRVTRRAPYPCLFCCPCNCIPCSSYISCNVLQGNFMAQHMNARLRNLTVAPIVAALLLLYMVVLPGCCQIPQPRDLHFQTTEARLERR